KRGVAALGHGAWDLVFGVLLYLHRAPVCCRWNRRPVWRKLGVERWTVRLVFSDYRHRVRGRFPRPPRTATDAWRRRVCGVSVLIESDRRTSTGRSSRICQRLNHSWIEAGSGRGRVRCRHAYCKVWLAFRFSLDGVGKPSLAARLVKVDAQTLGDQRPQRERRARL